MKNIVFALAALLSATAFAAIPTGDYMTWFGSDAAKDVTNSSGSSFYGAWSGEAGQYLNYSGFFGALSGYRAYDVNRSLGFGSWALRDCIDVAYTVAMGVSAGRGAMEVDNCVFIGNGAGRDAENCTNCVFIGKNAGFGFFNTPQQSFDGLIDINGKFKCDGNNVFITNGSTVFGMDSNGSVSFFAGGLSTTLTPAYISTESVFCTKVVGAVQVPGWDAVLSESGITLQQDINYLRDYADRVRKSLAITDEDTGEKYIIKVKSGALKLYKVEETEE